MTEKEQLIENVKESLPIAEKMKPVEDSIEELEAKIAENHVGWFMIGMSAFMFILGISAIISAGNSAGIIFAIIGVVMGFIVAKRKGVTASATRKLDEARAQYTAYHDCNTLAWLPEKYRTSSCIARIAGYVRDARVDTLKEAVNMLEAEMAQQRLEASAAVGAYLGAKENHY